MQWDLISIWNSLMFDCIELAAASVTKIWAYSASWLPWPFKPRSAIIGFHGINLLRPAAPAAASSATPATARLRTRDGFLVLFSTENDGVPAFYTPAPIPEADKDRVRIHSLPGSCIILTPIDHEQVPAAHRRKPKAEGGFFSGWFSGSKAKEAGAGAEQPVVKPPGTRATVLMHLDPKIASPPTWLIHWALRTFFPFIYTRKVQRSASHKCLD